MIAVLLGFLAFQSASPSDNVGPLVRSLWMLQRFGTAEAVNPANDQRVKAVLAKAIAKDGEIKETELGGLMSQGTFNRIAGADGTIDASDLAKAVDSSIPASRKALNTKAREHADYLTTTFDMIDAPHREAGQKLAAWIVANHDPVRPLEVVVICTGNSRRSILGAMMGNLAAAYYGMPQIRFHSGGTAPTAFNKRTIAALEDIGFMIETTGREAARGEPQTANPTYRVKWGEGMESLEFSKRFTDPSNPQSGFAALMVCSEADSGCPFVKGAALRVSMPYLDPKIYDDTAYETAKYAERRDDIGRLMLSVMAQARRDLASKP